MRPFFLVVIGALVLGLSSGCGSTQSARGGGLWGGRVETPSNFYVDKLRVAAVNRVVLMPVYAPGVGLSAEKDLDTQFQAQLNGTQLFEVVTLSREELARRFGQRAFHAAGILTDVMFEYIEQVSQADAVLFVDISSYQPYQPIRIGIRGKLISLRDREVLWAVDVLYDGSDKRISEAAVAYEKKSRAPFDKKHRYRSILGSPARFTAFAVDRCLQTLPPHSNSR
jgi:hypothetical protein